VAITRFVTLPCFLIAVQFVDLRLPSSKSAAQQRSINLAISSRGITALRAIHPGASDRFLRAAIPMRGRMIHDMQGNQNSQTYDRNGQVMLRDWARDLCQKDIVLLTSILLVPLVVHQLHRPCTS
jgi:kynurenine 3-monooxygenase